MALFASKKNTPVKKTTSKKEVEAKAVPVEKNMVIEDAKDVLLRPRVTEKAANMTALGVYTFDIRKSATKRDVAAAVKKLYKVTVVKVTVVNTPAKRVPLKKKRGFGKTTSSRKAMVFLKKGEQIQFS